MLAFFALAFAWSWACWLLAPGLKTYSPAAALVLTLAAGIGPSLAAVLVVSYCHGRHGLRRWLLRCLQWRVGWRVVLLAFMLPPVFIGLAAAMHLALGGVLPQSPFSGQIWVAVASVLVMFFIGGAFGEEFGWRGYALPALQQRYGWRVASLLLGAVWAAWHLPLFYIANAVQSHLPMGLYALSVVASSVLFAWLFNRSQGSVVPVLTLHTAINAWTMIIPVMALPDGSNQRPFQIVVVVQVLVAIALLWRGHQLVSNVLRVNGEVDVSPLSRTNYCSFKGVKDESKTRGVYAPISPAVGRVGRHWTQA